MKLTIHMQHTRALFLCGLVSGGLIACTQEESAGETATVVQEIVMGPADGHELSGADLDRVTAGDLAPDFTAMSLAGDTITLSQYRGEKNVVLVFYRGHW